MGSRTVRLLPLLHCNYSQDLLELGEMVAANLEGLIKDSNIMHMLIQKMKDSLPKVCQASFKLFFELVESCFDDIIRPHLRKLLLCYYMIDGYS